MREAIFSQSSVRETVLSKNCFKDRLSTFLSRYSPVFPGGSQMAAIWEWRLSMGTGAADMKCVSPGKCKCVDGWDKTWNFSCAYFKNVGHYTPSTLVRILGRDSCLRTTRWIRAEALNLDGLYSNVCSTKRMTGDKLWIFLFLLVRIKIVPPLWEVVNT